MICIKPFVQGGTAFGCGQCLPCRVRKRKEWTHRIMLESFCHTENAFVTLTYDDDKLRKLDDGTPILSPRDLMLWLKRLRELASPLKFRFFGVGEYGERTFRPHYHVILFGAGMCRNYRTKRTFGTSAPDWRACCNFCEMVGRSWGLGLVDIGQLTPASAGYVSSYTVKKMTRHDDVRLGGRPPEFTRMSLRPGIGADAMWQVASDMLRLDRDGDVPPYLIHGTKKMPLGRYLQNKLRVRVGNEEGACPETLQKMADEMLPMRILARTQPRSLSSLIGDQYMQHDLNEKAKLTIYKKRKF